MKAPANVIMKSIAGVALGLGGTLTVLGVFLLLRGLIA